MKRIGKTIGVMMVLIVAHGGICFCEATPAESSFVLISLGPPIEMRLEPVSYPTSSGPVDILLQIRPLFDCDKATVTVASVDKLEYSGPMSWVAEFEEDSTYSTILQVVIPPNDTSGIEVQVKGGPHGKHKFIYFITVGDSVEVKPVNLRSHRPKPSRPPETADPIRDTLTEEQLQTQYEVLLDLRDSTHLKFAEEILGPMSGSGKYKSCNACYILNVSLENLFKLGDEGIEIEFTAPPPWSRRYRAPKDSLPQPLPTPSPEADEINVDTLTPEQLQTEHGVMLWFRDSTERKLAEQVVGSMQDSLRLHGRWSVFRVKMRLEKFLEIRKHDVDVHLLKPHQWRHQTPQDSVPPPTPQDTVKPQGALDELHKSAYQLAWISLDHVDGLTAEGELARNQPITFYLQVINWWMIVDGLSNGFRIYSPDGAQWSTTSADTLPFGWNEMFSEYFDIRSYSANGTDADTVAFVGIAPYPSGMPLMFNEVAFKITIGPIGDEYAGKMICLDSSFFAGGGYWEWSCCMGSYVYHPAWDGPHCFTIEPNLITFSGYLYYLDPVPPDTTQKPMRDVTIEMWDYDDVFDDSLDATVTDDNGYFLLGPVENDDGWLGGGLDVFFRIYAENQAVYVTESEGGDTIKMQTAVGDDLTSGVYDTVIVAPLDSSGPFYIADVVLEGFDKWLSYQLGNIPPYLPVVLNATVETGFDTVSKYIGINNSDDTLDWEPNTFDKDVILHEYGHWLSYAFDFFDISPCGPHAWWMKISPEFAATEAFGHLWSAVVRSDVILRNYWNDFNDYYDVNVENGEYGYNGSMSGSANNYGDSCEAAVAGILWDIFDNVIDDYSTFGYFPTSPPFDSSDGIGDTLWDGIDSILFVLLDRYVSGHHPDNIDEFWLAWFSTWSPGHGQAMMDIWYEHGEIMHCCNHDGMRGNVDGVGGINVSDLTYLVDYLFFDDQPPPCPEEGDVNGDGAINVADLSYLVDYQFFDGPPPAPCP